jgi:hypothetical protein
MESLEQSFRGAFVTITLPKSDGFKLCRKVSYSITSPLDMLATLIG